MDRALEVQTKTQAKKHTTFNNMKKTHFSRLLNKQSNK
jgi:hypothetical protein